MRLEQPQQQATSEVPVRFEGLPAEYLQVDWGEIRHFPFTQQASATRYFLACRLKYSRWTWVRFTAEMRQETLFRGLVDCFLALGWVPWVLVFDNMKTVTTGRDAQQQPVWHPALLQLAAEFDFHPEACWPGAGNQKGSVESLVKWVKGNFLAGRVFADDADLGAQCAAWLTYANTRVSQATDVAPLARLAEEAAKGGRCRQRLRLRVAPAGPGRPGRWSPMLGNSYSVPIAQVGAPVTVRVHRERIVIWRDAERLAEHARAPDGAHRRVVDPAHFAPLFGRKPRAQVMLYREALHELGPLAAGLRRRTLAPAAGAPRRGDPGAVCAVRASRGTRAPGRHGVGRDPGSVRDRLPAGADRVAGLGNRAGVRHRRPGDRSRRAGLADLPPQAEVDRALSSYETYVWTPDCAGDHEDALATPSEVLP